MAVASLNLISSVSTTQIGYGQTFSIQTPNADQITRVTLVALSSVTHSFNMGQRFNELGFGHNDSQSLNGAVPADGNECPPGPYLLFILDNNNNSVPSVASIVSIQP